MSNVHKIKRHVVPDMAAVNAQLEIVLQDLELMMDTMRLCHHVDQEKLALAECLRDGMTRELIMSMREHYEPKS